MKKGIVFGLALALLISVGGFPASAALLSPADHPKFTNDLPRPARIDVTSGAKLKVEMAETVQDLGLVGTEGTLTTTVWGYDFGGKNPTYPGSTLVARENVPVEIRWENSLPVRKKADGTGHLLAVDQSIHLVDPVKKALDGGYIATVVHLHGGHTESASDGLPEAWFTQGFTEVGPFFVKKNYYYDNDQEAATLWYHDHALGITRLNVYAGLAGFYLLRDDNELSKIGTALPSEEYEIEIVIQDRNFTADGQLVMDIATEPEVTEFDPVIPSFPLPGQGDTNDDGIAEAKEPFPVNSIVAEFFGDYILVNGKAWPKLEVEPRKYRLRMLNGSDSRFYVLEFRNAEVDGAAQPFLEIGTDGGFLNQAVELTRLVIGPGERYDLVVDFSAIATNGEGQVFLRNFGPSEPFRGLTATGENSDGAGGVLPPSPVDSSGQIMRFDVSGDAPSSDVSVVAGTTLNGIAGPPDGIRTRRLALFEGLDEYGRLQPMLGTAEPTIDVAGNRVNGSLGWFQPITENPGLNDTEIWEIYNATEDAHPIHLHLVFFQIIDRQPFEPATEVDPVTVEVLQPQHDGSFGVGGQLASAIDSGYYSFGTAREPEEQEGADPDNGIYDLSGKKDTAIMLPGEVTRVIATFDREGRYVWHCHILSHEDHEMMRPYYIGEMPSAHSE
jgi:spore coat protein A